jgi:hypothetical protein
MGLMLLWSHLSRKATLVPSYLFYSLKIHGGESYLIRQKRSYIPHEIKVIDSLKEKILYFAKLR